jgi:hypothetical protein
LSCTCNVQSFEKDKCSFRGSHGHDRMVVGFTTTCAYYHWSCEYKPHWKSLSVICDRSVVFSGYSDFLHQQNWLPRYSWNILVFSFVNKKEVRHGYMGGGGHVCFANYTLYLSYIFIKKNPIFLYNFCQKWLDTL